MELLRTIVWGALLCVALLLWNAWRNDYPSDIHTPPTPQHAASPKTAAGNFPPTASEQPGLSAGSIARTPLTHERTIRFKTDVLSGVINAQSGDLIRVNLLNYPESTQHASMRPLALLNDEPSRVYIAQTRLIPLTKPNGKADAPLYRSPKHEYVLSPDGKTLRIDLYQRDKNLDVHKQYVFRRDDYQIEVRYQIRNRSASPWQGQLIAQLQRRNPPLSGGSLFSAPSYVGGALSSEEKPYKKLPFQEMRTHPLDQTIQNGWIAMTEPYFLSAWIPPKGQPFRFYTQAEGEHYTLGMAGPSLTLAPGAQADTAVRLYAGPALIDRLKAAAPHLALNVDFGILWFIAVGLLWTLQQFHWLTGNWGWAIVLVTVLLKAAFHGLSAKSYRSMAVMRRLQPQLQALKERHGDDRQQMAKATMELYRRERVNPLGGCLPTLVQIPVFIALYWVILESVELRQAPFIGWIQDLSTKDPYYVLPLLMGGTMFLQQRLSPPPADPSQATAMKFLPIFFTALFLHFPAGLVLYWLVNNTLSVLQQWWMMRRA